MPDRATSEVPLTDAKFMMANLFTSVDVMHFPHFCNYVAIHELTRAGRYRDLGHPVVWMNPLSTFINHLLVRELAESCE
jgi:hypothetical protein